MATGGLSDTTPRWRQAALVAAASGHDPNAATPNRVPAQAQHGAVGCQLPVHSIGLDTCQDTVSYSMDRIAPTSNHPHQS